MVWKQQVQKLRRFDVETTEKSTWKTHRYFVDFESRIHVEISTSNRCHNFNVDWPFKIDVISTNFPQGISTSNRWRIDEDVSIGCVQNECSFLLVDVFENFQNICIKVYELHPACFLTAPGLTW